MRKKQAIVFGLIGLICISQSGCALLQVPLKLANMAIGVASFAWQLFQVLPKPPPGVFF